MQKQKKITIAIDGLSSTGKSTLARQLAEALGYIYVDSGAMYRAITWVALKEKLIGADFFHEKQLIDLFPTLELTFKKKPEWDKAHTFVNNTDVEAEIRKMEVSRYVSSIAKIPEVRRKLVQLQQQMGKSKGVVMDGRDIGTVVFPDAELKIFMTASPKVRAKRRYAELFKNDNSVDFNDVLENLNERDKIDSTRSNSPLLKAPDAIEIDNSEMDLETQFQLALQYANKRIEKGVA